MCLEIPSFTKFISGIPHSGVISAAKASNSALAFGVLNFGSSSFYLLAANRPIFFLLLKILRIFKKTTVLKLDDKHSTFCNLLGQVQLSHLWCEHGHVRHCWFCGGRRRTRVQLLLWILLLVPNSFLKRTAFPYVKPNLV